MRKRCHVFSIVRRFIFIGVNGLLEKLREAELEVVRGWFRPGMKVLEIRGGSGFQAGAVASRGHQLVSIDLPGRPFPKPSCAHAPTPKIGAPARLRPLSLRHGRFSSTESARPTHFETHGSLSQPEHFSH